MNTNIYNCRGGNRMIFCTKLRRGGRRLAGGCLVLLLSSSGLAMAEPGMTTSGHELRFVQDLAPGLREISIPTLDISDQSKNQVLIAQGRSDLRNGHANTTLLPDGRTLRIIWTEGHGGAVRFFATSLDGGLSWSDPREDLPSNWSDHSNCPAFYRLAGPNGGERLVIFVNVGPHGHLMYRAVSDDDGETWSPFAPVWGDGSELPLGVGEKPAPTVMPFTAVVSVNDDRQLLGVTNLRRPGGGENRTNVVAQSYSHDGGESWSDWQIVLDLGDPFGPCEPELIRSPDGSQLTMLVRENRRSFNSWIMHSDDEGKTWSLPRQAPAALSMDRHQHRSTEDGRLIVVGRDTAAGSPTRRHFVAWVGRYEDLVTGGEGLYRIKLLHAHHGQVEYPSLEILPDETLVATTSLVYRPGENYSVVSTRFTLEETDRIFEETIRKTMVRGRETE